MSAKVNCAEVISVPAHRAAPIGALESVALPKLEFHSAPTAFVALHSAWSVWNDFVSFIIGLTSASDTRAMKRVVYPNAFFAHLHHQRP
jgi:hypothetical protein